MTLPVESGVLGPPEHIGLVVPDIAHDMARLQPLVGAWSDVTHPVATLRLPDGTVSRSTVAYVVSRSGFPRVKLIEEQPGTFWTAPAGSTLHHLSYWTRDLEATIAALAPLGWRVEAEGLEPDGSLRYVYLGSGSGARIELGRAELRAEFEAWAAEPREPEPEAISAPRRFPAR